MYGWRYRAAQLSLALLLLSVPGFLAALVTSSQPLLATAGGLCFIGLWGLVLWVLHCGPPTTSIRQVLQLLPSRLAVLLLTRTRARYRWTRFEHEFWDYLNSTHREHRGR